MIDSVTIGIPTFNRADLIGRALLAVAAQDLNGVQVIVADNASDGRATEDVVESFRASIPNLRYVRHRENIGVVANLKFLLDEARTPYFMWLADDDEIAPGFISALRSMLDDDPAIACAAGHWTLMRSRSSGQPMRTSEFRQQSRALRLMRFVWRSDDAFFYGLHRTDVLRSASFPGYWWPNHEITENWAYVFLFDVVAWGQIRLPSDPTVRFINHDYTVKGYPSGGRGVVRVARAAVRRVNVHMLYWKKAANHLGLMAVPAFVLLSALVLVRHISVWVRARLTVRIR